MADVKQPDRDSRFARQWNYRGAVPIQTSPVFQWPPNPINVIRWFAARWFVFGENLILVALASLTWFYLQPSLEQTTTLQFGWIAKMFLRNFILIALVAGGLHVFFHARKKQGDKLRFDSKEVSLPGKNFTAGSQLRDNMFWTLTSGVLFWTGFEVLMFWAMSNGYAPILWWVDNPIWLVVLFLLTPTLDIISFLLDSSPAALAAIV